MSLWGHPHKHHSVIAKLCLSQHPSIQPYEFNPSSLIWVSPMEDEPTSPLILPKSLFFSPSSGLGSSSLRDTTNIQPNIPKLPLCQARVSVERVAAGRGLSLVWGGTSPLGCQLLVNSLEAW